MITRKEGSAVIELVANAELPPLFHTELMQAVECNLGPGVYKVSRLRIVYSYCKCCGMSRLIQVWIKDGKLFKHLHRSDLIDMDQVEGKMVKEWSSPLFERHKRQVQKIVETN